MEIIKKLINHYRNGILIEKIFKYTVAILYKIYNSFLFRHLFNFLLTNRRKIKRFEKSLTPIDDSFYKIANYYLPVKNKLDKNSNFLSFGIGSDVDFEVEVYSQYGVSVNCFDPTPRSEQFINEINLKYIKFFPVGLSEDSGKLTFYQTKPYSDYTLIKPNIYWDKFNADCFSIDNILKKLNINFIDLIKLDIEGAAIDSINQLCSSPNRFGILISELEFMEKDIENYTKKVNKIVDIANQNNYDLFRLPKIKSNFKSIEIIIVNRN